MNNLVIRSITGLIFVTIVIGSILWGPYIQALVFSVFMLIGLLEFYRLFKNHPLLNISKEIGVFIGVFIFVLLVGISMKTLPVLSIAFIFPLFFTLVLVELWKKHANPIINISVLVFGIIYVVIPFYLTIDLNLSALPEELQGFYLYFRGKNLFDEKEYAKALKYFSSVSDLNSFYHKALFYRSVCEEALGLLKESITHFELLLEELEKNLSSENMRDQVILNLGRIYYEKENFEKSIEYYSLLSRNSVFWLEAIFEGAWAFALIKNPNSTLGNLHTVLSPFYFKKINPEAHVLKAIILLKLCYYDEVKVLLDEFQLKFKPIEKSLVDFLAKIDKGVGTAFDYVKDENHAHETYFVVEKSKELSAYKKTVIFLENLEVEEEELKTHFKSSVREGIYRKVLKVKTEILATVDRKIINTAKSYLDELKEMFEQTILIEADSLLQKISRIKKELNIITFKSEEEFIGGMQKLVLGQALEYWPFDGEYWKDDLGGYVYNIPNLCKK